MRCFLLSHLSETANGDEDFKIIGVYSSEAAAHGVVERLKTLPGFDSAPEAFHVDAYEMNKDYWSDGFGADGS